MSKVTVIMPVYNGQLHIKKTIESVLRQTYADFEYLIIDDGSSDGTMDIIQSFSDSRIKVIQLLHGGIVKALNTGVVTAGGEYIIRIDADDICMPQRFEKLVSFMEKEKNIVVCGSWASSIDENDNIIGTLNYPPIAHTDIKKYMVLHNPFIHPSVIFRRKSIIKAGLYRNFKHNEDYELWTRMLKKDEGHNIPEYLIQYRIHSGQITKKNKLSMRIRGLPIRLLACIRNYFIFL